MAEKPRKHRGRRSYLEEFRRTASGEYVYTGALYEYSDPDRSRRRTMTELWLPAAVLLMSAGIQGCIPAAGMLNCVYVLLPFLGELLSAISAVWAMVRLSTAKEPIREYVYTSTVEVLPVRAVFSAAFAGAAVAGELIFLLTHGLTDPEKSLPLLALMLLAGAAALWLRTRAKALHWTRK